MIKDKKGGISTDVFGGIPADKKNFIHESISEYGEFDNKPQNSKKVINYLNQEKINFLVVSNL